MWGLEDGGDRREKRADKNSLSDQWVYVAIYGLIHATKEGNLFFFTCRKVSRTLKVMGARFVVCVRTLFHMLDLLFRRNGILVREIYCQTFPDIGHDSLGQAAFCPVIRSLTL